MLVDLAEMVDESLHIHLLEFNKKLQDKKYSGNTILSYLFDIKIFFNFLLIHYGVAKIDKEVISTCNIDIFRLWIANRIKNKISNSSNNRAISAIRVFYKFCKESGFCDNNSISLLNKARTPKILPKAIDYKDILYILQNLHTVSTNKLLWQNLRDKAIIILMFTAGLRISEVLSLTKKQYHSSEQFMYIVGKGNKERIVPLLEIAVDSVRQYLQSCPYPIADDCLLFVSNYGNKYSARVLQRNIANIRRNVNLPDYITPHSFRHACATEILKNGGDIRNIQVLLGHDSISTTERYLKLDSDRIISQIINKKIL